MNLKRLEQCASLGGGNRTSVGTRMIGHRCCFSVLVLASLVFLLFGLELIDFFPDFARQYYGEGRLRGGGGADSKLGKLRTISLV